MVSPRDGYLPPIGWHSYSGVGHETGGFGGVSRQAQGPANIGGGDRSGRSVRPEWTPPEGWLSFPYMGALPCRGLGGRRTTTMAMSSSTVVGRSPRAVLSRTAPGPRPGWSRRPTAGRRRRRTPRTDSSGLRILVEIANDLRPAGGRIAIINAQPIVLRVLELTGLDRTVQIDWNPADDR
jgi:hypothetical protein